MRAGRKLLNGMRGRDMSTLEALWMQPVTRALAVALAGFLWQGAAIAFAVDSLLACMRRRPAHERYALACLGLLVMAVLPGVSFGAALAGAAFEVSGSTWGGGWLRVLGPWLMAGWLCGVLLLSLRTLLAWKQALALSRRGARQPGALVARALERTLARTRVSCRVRLLESVAIEVPMVVGWWRPLILMPASALAGLSVLQLEAILAHELAHVRRHDILVNLLQALVETVLFFHPAVWWLSDRIREEREYCADDVAVESCGNALFYARALATLEQVRAGVPAMAVAATGGPLLRRIQRLLAAPTGGPPPNPWKPVGSLAAAALVAALGAMQ